MTCKGYLLNGFAGQVRLGVGVGVFTWQGWPEGFASENHPDSGELYEVLKYNIEIIFMINIKLLECW